VAPGVDEASLDVYLTALAVLPGLTAEPAPAAFVGRLTAPLTSTDVFAGIDGVYDGRLNLLVPV
jgi:hypothetical protein